MKIKNDLDLPSNRKFGFTFSVLFLLLSFYFYYHQAPLYCVASSVLGFIFFLAAFQFPNMLSPLNRYWSAFGNLLHRITNPLILGLIFFLIMTPIALLFRVIGRDCLSLKKPNSSSTFWVIRPGNNKFSFKDQF